MSTLLAPVTTPVPSEVDDITRRDLHKRLGVLGAGWVLAGCGADGQEAAAPSPVATTRAFEHSQGTTEIPTRPARIVTITDQNALLPLLELGVIPVGSAGLVGDDGTKKFRRTEGFDASGVTFVGSYLEPNVEAIAELRPDLIVGHEVYDEYYETLSKIARPCSSTSSADHLTRP